MGAVPTLASSRNCILAAVDLPSGSSAGVGGSGLAMMSVIMRRGMCVTKLAATDALQNPSENSARVVTLVLSLIVMGVEYAIAAAVGLSSGPRGSDPSSV